MLILSHMKSQIKKLPADYHKQVKQAKELSMKWINENLEDGPAKTVVVLCVLCAYEYMVKVYPAYHKEKLSWKRGCEEWDSICRFFYTFFGKDAIDSRFDECIAKSLRKIMKGVCCLLKMTSTINSH